MEKSAKLSHATIGEQLARVTTAHGRIRSAAQVAVDARRREIAAAVKAKTG